MLGLIVIGILCLVLLASFIIQMLNPDYCLDWIKRSGSIVATAPKPEPRENNGVK